MGILLHSQLQGSALSFCTGTAMSPLLPNLLYNVIKKIPRWSFSYVLDFLETHQGEMQGQSTSPNEESWDLINVLHAYADLPWLTGTSRGWIFKELSIVFLMRSGYSKIILKGGGTEVVFSAWVKNHCVPQWCSVTGVAVTNTAVEFMRKDKTWGKPGYCTYFSMYSSCV